VWEEKLKIRVNSKTEDEREKATRKQKPKYPEGRGKQLQRLGDGWTDNGREYYQALTEIELHLEKGDNSSVTPPWLNPKRYSFL
jgi:hypothetical protein